MASLEFLELSSNFLTGSLPTTLGNLRNVTHLVFENNFLLTNIPTEFGSLERLEVMRGGINVIRSLPPELGRMTSAHIISLSDSSIAGPIPTELGLLTNLRKLSFYAWLESRRRLFVVITTDLNIRTHKVLIYASLVPC